MEKMAAYQMSSMMEHRGSSWIAQIPLLTHIWLNLTLFLTNIPYSESKSYLKKVLLLGGWATLISKFYFLILLFFFILQVMVVC